ncbi:TrkH family potassium uptake protein [Roseovarius sp.]|uniref:TrkH family potassium uptake protein n=1 Tax=Roseovarius sp. TaxID=1486281 RepID=UPI003B5ADC37
MARRSSIKLGSTRLSLSPPAVLAVMYFLTVALGALLLWLPASHHDKVGLGEAIFTATSAVTVTGLVVVDTGSDFTLFGQIIIACLMQFGGLGLMVFAVLILTAFGIPIGMPHKVMLREDLNQATISNLGQLVRIILYVALGCEAVGAVLLALVFVPELGWGQGLWYAVFHSISAFNNAGFALEPDSLSKWVGNPVVNLTVTVMFILGGLGFIVVGDVYQHRMWRKLSLHSKLMIAGTLWLIVIGVVCFALLEWNNPRTLAGLESTGDKLWASWFQGVTPRTAGFNTIDTAAMKDSTSLLTIMLMIVGGGSTSTAGGIKVTSLIVMLLATVAFFQRRPALHVFGRSLPLDQVLKVMALATISGLLMFASLFVLTATQNIAFRDLAFEVASAFGTVGLSHGATGELNWLGRAVIIAVMFLGRVGPLTLGFFLAVKSRPRVRYPGDKVFLG